MKRRFPFNNLSLLIHFPRLGMALDHIDTLNRGFVLSGKNLEHLSHPALILSRNNFNLIVCLEVCSTLSHLVTYLTVLIVSDMRIVRGLQGREKLSS